MVLRYLKLCVRFSVATSTSPSPKTLQLARAIQVIHKQCNPEELRATWLPHLHTMADLVLPYLRPEEISLIWNDFKSAQCHTGSPVLIRQWVDLYQALVERNFVAVSALTKDMLPKGAISSSLKNDYLLMAAMLAEIALDQKSTAQKLWHRYQPDEQIPLVLRLMSSYIGAY